MTFQRKLAWTLVAAVLAGVLWLIAAYQLFHNPPHSTPQRTDAIVVLGGMSSERLLVGLALRDQLGIPDLVVITTACRPTPVRMSFVKRTTATLTLTASVRIR
ncbi:hypothetical protein ARTHRO9V_90182 [Arthrobacter sp. 9V]|uniref:hypothetical protein n=1 Tax=Arthrobacter sp. 9V TaxID=2653132 RepID=UPI0012EEFA52|nr:hypothetical protein [Arthrobacter sp. 9V]VXC66635.1 hypothetical protein ARTHRO9V_90182 [Arthrobacter sp. 9V]